MKISKLFHWLYAILMMLPVFFIGGRMIYVTFNKNAKDSWSGENQVSINYKYETNEVNTANDLIDGNIYKITNYKSTDNFKIHCTRVYFLSRQETNYINYDADFIAKNNCYFYIEDTAIRLLDQYGTFLNNVTNTINNSTFYFVYKNVNTPTGDFNKITASDYLPIESVDITQNTLDNAFEYSLNEINTNPLFSWAKDSFLVTPFRFITNLFGMPSDSPITTLLSYWLDISIIYLVFDVVMYLPLLAHRWIDKGMIE